MATETTRGMCLPCPLCGESGATILLDLTDLAFHCGDCDEDFTQADVRTFIHQWTKVLAWVDTFPAAE